VILFMATVVNTPAASHEHMATESDSSSNMIWGVLIVLVVAFLLFYFGLPLLRNIGGAGAPQQINNNVPPQGANAPQISVPDKVNVDVNPNAGGGNAPAPQQ
jgi:hypothetical protein